MTDHNPTTVLQRCAPDGTACVEIVARTEAAMRTIYIEGCREHGEELLAEARKWARRHGHDVERHEEAG